MARRARSQLRDGIFHVTSRGNRSQVVFADDGDRRFFVTLLHRITLERRWCVNSYCLLDTHYHVLIETSVAELSLGMKRLNGIYAQSFNARHGLQGHLFQERFYSGLVEGDGHLYELVRYIALNPVRAGLCTDASRWPWSSYGGLIGRRRAEPFVSNNRVLRLFSADPSKARQMIRSFVADS
jgi:putative transposase